jgi:hypothetical protein
MAVDTRLSIHRESYPVNKTNRADKFLCRGLTQTPKITKVNNEQRLAKSPRLSSKSRPRLGEGFGGVPRALSPHLALLSPVSIAVAKQGV